MTTDRSVTRVLPPRWQWPAWMRVAIAEEERGVREKPGAADNARIIEYMTATRLADNDEITLHDELAWCASLVCWCLKQGGYLNPRYAMAKNFVHYGAIVKPHDVQFGDILVFRRDASSAHAHVCFHVNDLGGDFAVLGGNQKNSVCYSHENKADLLAIRRPVLP